MKPRSVVLSATAVLVALSPGTALAGPGDDGPVPGAAGIGDPYYPLDGNGGYDVQHYDLDLRYDPATDQLSGVATIEARATLELSSLNLDFQGLVVRSVSVDDRDTPWTRDGGELTVTPRSPLVDDQAFTVRVGYTGVPETDDALGVSGFMHTDDGAIVAGQPDVAATWFPANDHPRDAASVSVAITVPEGLEAISNGVLADRSTTGGWTTWQWRADEPMATYLVVLAIGEFDVRNYTADGLRFWDAVDPDLFTTPATEDGNGPSLGENAVAALEAQPEIINFLEGFFGPYPFDAAGGIVDDFQELQFALETQTRPIYSPLFFTDPLSGEVVVVHELAHQWFGDDVRLEAWRHIWLNEGTATYAEWLWLEEQGLVTAQEQFDFLLALPADDPFYAELWTVSPGDPGVDDLLSPSVYQRGAMTHHALRLELGDDTYFRFLRQWATSQAGGTATTEEFIALAEQVSGRQLDAFFEAWLFTPEKPAGIG